MVSVSVSVSAVPRGPTARREAGRHLPTLVLRHWVDIVLYILVVESSWLVVTFKFKDLLDVLVVSTKKIIARLALPRARNTRPGQRRGRNRRLGGRLVLKLSKSS